MEIDAALVNGFVQEYLKQRFDGAVDTPGCHVLWWQMCCSPDKYDAIAAPRGHAKTSAITHAYCIACMLFGFRDFCLIISDTEGQAIQFLNDIKIELKENEAIERDFGFMKFTKDTETEIIVSCDVGVFKIVAKGAEQKVRGLKWRNKRPNLILVDDLENDESVMNKERREKLRNWFFNALLPCGADKCLYRVVGTVLHMDSLLERLLNDPLWNSRRFQAHNPDFSKILWPEKFPRERLQQIRAQYYSQGNPEGYSQEYLNVPMDEASAFFKRDWFIPMNRSDHSSQKTYYVGVDLAISQKEHADYSVVVVVGVDPQNICHVVDLRTGRWDAFEICEQIFACDKEYSPDEIFMEQGTIEKSIGPTLNLEMHRRGQYLNITTVVPTKDKKTRAKGIQKMMKAGGFKFDMEAEWFADLADEMTRFPRGKHDDRVDALSLIGLKIDSIAIVMSQEEQDEEEYRAMVRETPQGKSVICGY